jgi:mevalonate kinase
MTDYRAQASAPGKAILLGEHAVVYGRPAIAVPLSGLRATVTAEPGEPGSGVVIEARDLGQMHHMERDAPDEAMHPLVVTVCNVLARLGVGDPGDLHLTIASDIPVASGLGSGAAVAVAMIRALDAWFAGNLTDADVSALAYETEVLHHGTPSGIDNNVVTYEQPIAFTRARGVEPFSLGAPLTLVVGDTGLASPTKETVGDVRRAWQAEPSRYEALFDAVAKTVRDGRAAIERGDAAALGAAMRRDHALLQEMGVSCPELDALVAAAEGAGSLGTKLSGGGRGGNMIALVTAEAATDVAAALRAAGAKRVLVSEIA